MKRKQFFISAIITLLLALFAGCNQSFSPALRKADQVLSADTEKGSEMLDSICWMYVKSFSEKTSARIFVFIITAWKSVVKIQIF